MNEILRGLPFRVFRLYGIHNRAKTIGKRCITPAQTHFYVWKAGSGACS